MSISAALEIAAVVLTSVALVEINAFSVIANVSFLAFRIAGWLDFAGETSDGVFANSSASAGMIVHAFIDVLTSDIFIGNWFESGVAFALVVDQFVVTIGVLAANARVDLAFVGFWNAVGVAIAAESFVALAHAFIVALGVFVAVGAVCGS